MMSDDIFIGKKPDIIMVLPSWEQRCGISEYTRSLTDALKKEGCNIRIVKNVVDLLETGNITETDIVHLQYEYSLFAFQELQNIITQLRSKRISFLITAHSYTQQLPVYNDLLKEVTPLIVHSTHIAEKMSSEGWNSKALRVINMGVDNVYQNSNINKMKQELKINGNPCIGFFGFMHWYKGIFPLLEAVEKLKKTNPQIKCYMFSGLSENEGSHKYYKLFQKKLKIFNIDNNIILNMDFLPSELLIKQLSLMDINILPYVDFNYYATSAAVRILLSAGKPIITSNSNFFADLQHEVLKIAGVSSKSIANAVSYLHKNVELQEHLRKKGEDYVKAHSWKICAQKHLEVYKELCNLR